MHITIQENKPIVNSLILTKHVGGCMGLATYYLLLLLLSLSNYLFLSGGKDGEGENEADGVEYS
jgi:hypothetical protein